MERVYYAQPSSMSFTECHLDEGEVTLVTHTKYIHKVHPQSTSTLVTHSKYIQSIVMRFGQDGIESVVGFKKKQLTSQDVLHIISFTVCHLDEGEVTRAIHTKYIQSIVIRFGQDGIESAVGFTKKQFTSQDVLHIRSFTVCHLDEGDVTQATHTKYIQSIVMRFGQDGIESVVGFKKKQLTSQDVTSTKERSHEQLIQKYIQPIRIWSGGHKGREIVEIAHNR